MIEEIKKMPKIELHLHLDGAVSINLLREFANLSLEETIKKTVAPSKCHDLGEYLEKFPFVDNLLSTKENLTRATADLLLRLHRQNVVYAEIRFAPMSHTSKGLSYEEIVEAVLGGIKKVPLVKCNLILCMRRGNFRDENLKTLLVAEKYLNKGVCAIDLVGDEATYPIDDYLYLFDLALEKKIPFTIHAGEVRRDEEVSKALSVHARRLGHGIQIVNNPENFKLVQDNNVLLEVCPTSNVMTNVVSDYISHPIRKLYDSGIKVCINTDNPTISNITLTEEYLKLYDTFKFTKEDFLLMNKNALEFAFLSDLEKKELEKLLK